MRKSRVDSSIGPKYLHNGIGSILRISPSRRTDDSGMRLAYSDRMIGVTRHFALSIDPLDAGQPLDLALPQLYVISNPQERSDDDAVPLSGKSGKVLQLPARPNGPAAHVRPRRQFHCNTVDWPRGYPAHDDL